MMNMQMKPGLWQQQTFKLAMTQELSQAIALLQYSTQELAAFLEAKAVGNPFIKLEHPDLKALHKKERKLRPSHSASEKNWVETMADFSHTIVDHVRMQCQMIQLSKAEKRIFEFLLCSLDQNGYLHIDSKEAAYSLKEQEQAVLRVMSFLKQMEPAGIGAKNLQECLLLQAERRLDAPFLAEQILRHHFSEFAEKTWKPLAKKLQVNLQDIQQAADFIKTLNPRPGAAFESGSCAYVRPDLTVKQAGEQLEVHLLDEELPKIVFEKNYFIKIQSIADAETKKFLKEKEKEYQWLMRSLEQRQQTIQRVGLKIVEKQQAFFYKGPSALQPMIMKEIADELSIHESTVSRTVRGKYMQTPFGMFELKFFFPSGFLAATESEETLSARQIQGVLQQLIQDENKQKPLSDQVLCDKLKQQGMAVSRRTVAKYREQLHIPSSAKRKRYD